MATSWWEFEIIVNFVSNFQGHLETLWLLKYIFRSITSIEAGACYANFSQAKFYDVQLMICKFADEYYESFFLISQIFTRGYSESILEQMSNKTQIRTTHISPRVSYVDRALPFCEQCIKKIAPLNSTHIKIHSKLA